MFLRKTSVVGTRAAPEKLGGDDHVTPSEAQFAKSLAKDLLALPGGIDFGRIKVIDSMIPGLEHALLADVVADLSTN
jgi:hypothetical protein